MPGANSGPTSNTKSSRSSLLEAALNRASRAIRKTLGSAFDRDGLQLEVSAAEKRSCPNKGARGILLGEIGFVYRIKFLEERQIGAGNLHVNKIVHRHSGLCEDVFFPIEQNLDFVLDF